VTPSYYIFESSKPVSLVDSTGDFGEYMNGMEAARVGDTYTPKKNGKAKQLRIPRQSVAWMIVENP
jgi:hypothetical protein